MSIPNFIKNPTQLVAILSIALVGGVTLLVSTMAQENTQLPPVRDTADNIVESGIVEMQQVKLGGIDQWILVRGQSFDNPVLLFLNGGPGGAIIPWVDLFQTAELEEFSIRNMAYQVRVVEANNQFGYGYNRKFI